MAVSQAKEKRSLTDLQGSDYLRFPLPHEERVKHLESWLREALILPFSYSASIDKLGQFVSFGQKMVEINEHAVEVRKGQVGEERVKAEMEGVVRLEELFNQADPGDLLFLFSPPGSTEEGFGSHDQRRLSFTYIFEVNEGKGDDKKSVRAIAIPSPEISPLIQMKQFSDVFVKEEMTALTKRGNDPIDRKLVATPILISKLVPEERVQKLDKYVRSYVGKSWEEIEETIDNGLKLQNDEHAEVRRKSLIESISWQIRRYVDEGNGLRLNNIGEATRVVLAREASGHYLNVEPEELLAEYQKTEGAMWMQLQYQLAGEEEQRRQARDYGAELFIAERHLRSIREALANDPGVAGILMGSSCGGGGLGGALDFIGDKYGELVTSRGHILELQLESLKENSGESTSSGEMKCVTCPFCSQVVDAIVTSDKISCPSCGKSASRG